MNGELLNILPIVEQMVNYNKIMQPNMETFHAIFDGFEQYLRSHLNEHPSLSSTIDNNNIDIVINVHVWIDLIEKICNTYNLSLRGMYYAMDSQASERISNAIRCMKWFCMAGDMEGAAQFSESMLMDGIIAQQNINILTLEQIGMFFDGYIGLWKTLEIFCDCCIPPSYISNVMAFFIADDKQILSMQKVFHYLFIFNIHV